MNRFRSQESTNVETGGPPAATLGLEVVTAGDDGLAAAVANCGGRNWMASTGRSGKGSGGRRTVSLTDVAREAGVSTGLASIALNGRYGVSPTTRDRILAVADRLGYQANPIARALRTGASDTLGLVIRNISNPYFLDVIIGAERAAVEAGKTLLVVDCDYSLERERASLTRLATQRVDGLAIAPVGAGESVRMWRSLQPSSRVVVVNATAPGIRGVAHVGPDNVQAVELAVRHLAGLGHVDIAFLTAPPDLMADPDRLTAFTAISRQLHLRGRAVQTPLSLSKVYQATRRMLSWKRPPTAVVTNSDFTAHAVYKAARDCGVRVGRDLAVVGHDDLPTSELLDPPLTTLRVDGQAIGRAAVARLVGDPARALPDHHEPVALVARGSSRRVRTT
jgi:LacI family transcriptional regulator